MLEDKRTEEMYKKKMKNRYSKKKKVDLDASYRKTMSQRFHMKKVEKKSKAKTQVKEGQTKLFKYAEGGEKHD